MSCLSFSSIHILDKQILSKWLNNYMYSKHIWGHFFTNGLWSLILDFKLQGMTPEKGQINISEWRDVGIKRELWLIFTGKGGMQFFFQYLREEHELHIVLQETGFEGNAFFLFFFYFDMQGNMKFLSDYMRQSSILPHSHKYWPAGYSLVGIT